MYFKEFKFKSRDNEYIVVYNWLPKRDTKLRGVVQIVHGMLEYALRYKYFAKALVKAGFVVYAHDQRGHGNTAKSFEELAYFAENDGWDLAVSDIGVLNEIIRQEYGDIPLFLFGHSMGSFLLRDYVTRDIGKINGVILSGTAGNQGVNLDLGLLVAKVERLLRGDRARSYILNKLSFLGYNKGFESSNTPFDWLTRAKDEVRRYMENPLCGGVPTISFFQDLLSGLKKINQLDSIEQIPKELPFYIFSGADDPVGKRTKGVLEMVEKFQSSGIEDITCKFYEGGRHEMLNEVNKEEVIADVISWINNRIGE